MHIKHNVLHRNKVNEELNNIKNFPLTIITAPMGYGKSTAVKEYISTSQLNHIWISLNEACKNTGYFWSILTKRISEVNNKLGNSLNGLGFPQDSMQSSRIIDLFQSYPPPEDFILVLDDYQFSENDLLNKLLLSLIKRDIPNYHIVLISRYLLKLDITELIVKNLAYSIDQRSLRFSDTEVQQYFSCMSMPVNIKQVTQIQNLADGWAAALYLVYRGMKQGFPLENIIEIKELLKNSLYDNYDLETKLRLCALSVTDDFTCEMAAYSTGIDTINETIERLCRENAFIQHDLKTGIYTIHNVFRSFLKNESIKMGINIKEICRRAGYWYISKNDINQGFYYLFMGEDYDAMLCELEKPALYVKSSDRPMMFYYFDSIPDIYMNKHPIAYLKFIMMFIITGDKKRGASLLSQFEEKISEINYNEKDLNEIKAAIHLIKVFLSFNNLKVMINHTVAVLELLNGKASVISSHQGPFSFGSPHLTYIYYKEAGTFKKISEMSLEKYAQASGGAGIGSEALCSAEYCFETGNFKNAEVYALKSIYQAKAKNQTSMVVCAVFTLARLYICQDKYSEALSLLIEISKDVSSNVESILLNTFDLCLGYIYACTKEFEKIPKWIKDGDMTINSLLMQGAVFSYVVYGKTLILSENWSKAEALCETFNGYFGIFNNQLGYLHNYINLSIASFKRGDAEKSKEWLKKSLFIGQADDIVMPFAENGANLLPILKCINKDDGFDMNYISNIINLCTHYESIISNCHNNILTSREVEILNLVSKGMSRGQIAERLIISVSTVRTHIQNIYQKLGVNKKSEAIYKASQLKII